MKKTFLLFIFFSILLAITYPAQAKPKIQTSFGFDRYGFAQVKIKNETERNLVCYVAIDGHKEKFILLRFRESDWYIATDKRFTYKSFSTWCDYQDLYPDFF